MSIDLFGTSLIRNVLESDALNPPYRRYVVLSISPEGHLFSPNGGTTILYLEPGDFSNI